MCSRAIIHCYSIQEATCDWAGIWSHVQAAEASFVPLPFDVPAARAYAGVAASLHTAGRKTAARAYDAMIAATAIANGLPVYTCNPADFAGIDDLVVVAIQPPGASG